ncbi:uncharacterized protein LOC116614913 [Nematostella vectensis]|uniref:uncharacterized protein LOC116614913 n=1 Tax=Nematostella vectensis TaxID=45351 RepID=UPI002077412F|nr:uncharacterized protein LOC116614913 [Nematostella vectensis]
MRSNALTLWLEDLTTSGLRVCARELQTFDREHKGIHVHWLAFATLPEDMVAEHHKMSFTSDQPPSLANAFCDGLNFTRTYETMPTIVLSVNHYTGAGGLVPEYNSITAWVEIATKSYCQVCLRQSRGLNGHDPLFVDVVVLG